ncbi:MAG: hypothetical protein DMF30_09640 [Verrucomicrobia bacterium]|nr:MAG: hypothetical protein DMF30_09640 [Verrucomicrobiota bacterium]
MVLLGGVVKIYPAQISMRVISLFLKNLIGGCIFLVLAGSATSSDALPSGVMEGHLKILSSKPVDLGDENAATATAENYADYPLLILSVEGQKEIRGRTRGHLHAKPQRFTVVSNETVRVDMDIDTDHWRVRSTQSFRPD